MVQLSHSYMTTGKTTDLTRWIFVGKAMSLLLNMLSRLVRVFLPRSKRLLIPCLQSPSAVILEPKKIKPLTVSTVYPSICHGLLGLDAMILFMGFSRQEYWSGLPFLSPGDHILSELSTITCPSWVALHSMAHSFIELDKAVVHVICLISFLWLWFSLCLPSDERA